jgi:hypothetical protein
MVRWPADIISEAELRGPAWVDYITNTGRFNLRQRRVLDRHDMSLDQYCVRPGCRCKDVHLNLLPITEGRALETTGVVSVDYATKAWMRVEDEPLPCDVATIKGLIEGAIPDFYGKLPARHDKLRAIYANCRKRWRAAVADVIIKEPAGRNDPCPCGSGKKFKRCCMGKANA